MIEYIVYVLHPFYTLIHMAAGAVLFPILLWAKLTTLKEKLSLYFIGAVIAIVPDIPKIILLHFGHSIFFTPFISLLLAYFLKKYLQTSFIRIWMAVALTIILAHLLLDFLGNGVEILYPIVPDEYAFHIISDERVITIFLSVGLLCGLLTKYTKTVLLSFLVVLCLFLGYVGYSKVQLEQSVSQYSTDTAYV